MALKKERYISTITVYSFGETKEEAFKESQQMCDILNKKFDCRADIEEMSKNEFGKTKSFPIDIQKLKSKF